MPPGVIGHHGVTTGTVVFRVQCVQGIQAVLEPLHLSGLAQHRPQQAAHQGDHPLFEFPGPAVLPSPLAADGQAQGPDALHGIDAIPHPGVAVVAMDRVGGAGGQQTADGVLAFQHHLADGAVQPLNHGIDTALIPRDFR